MENKMDDSIKKVVGWFVGSYFVSLYLKNVKTNLLRGKRVKIVIKIPLHCSYINTGVFTQPDRGFNCPRLAGNRKRL